MGYLSDFLQDNWFELGSLVAQFGILAVIAWYARMKLRVPTASHRKVESAVTISESPDEIVPREPAKATYRGVGRMLSPLPTAPSLETVPTSAERVQRTSPWRAVMRWLRTPMTFGTRVRPAL
jgi:hypothetical protein